MGLVLHAQVWRFSGTVLLSAAVRPDASLALRLQASQRVDTARPFANQLAITSQAHLGGLAYFQVFFALFVDLRLSNASVSLQGFPFRHYGEVLLHCPSRTLCQMRYNTATTMLGLAYLRTISRVKGMLSPSPTAK